MEPCNLPPLNTTIDIPIEVEKGFSTPNQLQVLTAAGEFLSPTIATPDINPLKEKIAIVDELDKFKDPKEKKSKENKSSGASDPPKGPQPKGQGCPPQRM